MREEEVDEENNTGKAATKEAKENTEKGDLDRIRKLKEAMKSRSTMYKTCEPGPQAAFTGPRDVWDISLRMISSFDIAKYLPPVSL